MKSSRDRPSIQYSLLQLITGEYELCSSSSVVFCSSLSCSILTCLLELFTVGNDFFFFQFSLLYSKIRSTLLYFNRLYFINFTQGLFVNNISGYAKFFPVFFFKV